MQIKNTFDAVQINIMFDGVPPMSKIIQQKKRRIIAIYENSKWD